MFFKAAHMILAARLFLQGEATRMMEGLMEAVDLYRNAVFAVAWDYDQKKLDQKNRT